MTKPQKPRKPLNKRFGRAEIWTSPHGQNAFMIGVSTPEEARSAAEWLLRYAEWKESRGEK